MSEHINGQSLLSSGGHVWIWEDLQQTDKRLGAAGLYGEARMVISSGVRFATITGREGSPAVLKAANNAALNALEDAIVYLQRLGSPVSWEDDCGRSGDYLVITNFSPVGERLTDGTSVWQFYTLRVCELYGRP